MNANVRILNNNLLLCIYQYIMEVLICDPVHQNVKNRKNIAGALYYVCGDKLKHCGESIAFLVLPGPERILDLGERSVMYRV